MGRASRDSHADEAGCPRRAVHAPWLGATGGLLPVRRVKNQWRTIRYWHPSWTPAPNLAGGRFMSAAWVVALLILFTFDDVPLVQAQEQWPPGNVPFGAAPMTFKPQERLDAPGQSVDLYTLPTSSPWYGSAE